MIETEFLFGLNPSDRLGSKVKIILDLIKKTKMEVRCLASAFLEAIFVMKSKGIPELEIKDIIVAMSSKLHRNRITIIEPITVESLQGCLALRELYEITFYDALHAAIALKRSATLISNDKVYDNLSGVKRLSFLAFSRKLEDK